MLLRFFTNSRLFLVFHGIAAYILYHAQPQKENPAVPDFLTSQLLLITIQKKEFADVLFSYFSHQLRERIFSWNQKQTISAHNRCRSNAFCCAAAAFCRSDLCSTAGRPGTAHSGWRHSGTIYQRAHDRAGKTAETPVCKAKKQPSDKVLHLLSFFITLLGVVLVLVLALTLLIPELVQLFTASMCRSKQTSPAGPPISAHRTPTWGG